MGKLKKAKKSKPGAGGVIDGKAAAKKAKAAKGEKKSLAKETKIVKKGKNKDKEDVMDEDDLIATLEQYRQQWADEHKVTEDVVDGPPSRRANATLTACPVKDHLYLFGGEYYDGSTVQIYPDLFRYAPDKNEWRRFTSPTAPGPRSAHQIVASPAGGGKLWLFGGEFSAPNQSSFHHYRDLWCFSIDTHSWERFDTKLRPSARSGHRMALWKHLIFLFGGFQDTGIRTSYLSDLWVWDTLEYKWHQIEIKDVDRKPGARSGFSFLSCPEGLILHGKTIPFAAYAIVELMLSSSGGYTKTYEGKRVTGMALSDTWLLRIPPSEAGEIDFRLLKWEKRKKIGYAPTPRSGCTMALWSAKNMGVLFGGVSDEDKDEESLDSTFYNELFGYNIAGAGRWISLPLKKKKKAGGKKRKPKVVEAIAAPSPEPEDEEMRAGSDDDGEDDEPKPWEVAQEAKEALVLDQEVDDPDDPEKSIPFSRYNAMLAVQRSTLYMYANDLSFPHEDTYNFRLAMEEYWRLARRNIRWMTSSQSNLTNSTALPVSRSARCSSFLSISIRNADANATLLFSDSAEWNGSDSENDESDSDSDSSEGSQSGSSDDDEEDGIAPEDEPMAGVELEALKLSDAEQAALDAVRDAEAVKMFPKEDLRKRATAFMGVSLATDRTEEDLLSTPQPGENLAKFYARSKEYWTNKAFTTIGSNNRGKELRRDGFSLAEEAFRPRLIEALKAFDLSLHHACSLTSSAACLPYQPTRAHMMANEFLSKAKGGIKKMLLETWTGQDTNDGVLVQVIKVIPADGMAFPIKILSCQCSGETPSTIYGTPRKVSSAAKDTVVFIGEGGALDLGSTLDQSAAIPTARLLSQSFESFIKRRPEAEQPMFYQALISALVSQQSLSFFLARSNPDFASAVGRYLDTEQLRTHFLINFSSLSKNLSVPLPDSIARGRDTLEDLCVLLRGIERVARQPVKKVAGKGSKAEGEAPLSLYYEVETLAFDRQCPDRKIPVEKDEIEYRLERIHKRCKAYIGFLVKWLAACGPSYEDLIHRVFLETLATTPQPQAPEPAKKEKAPKIKRKISAPIVPLLEVKTEPVRAKNKRNRAPTNDGMTSLANDATLRPEPTVSAQPALKRPATTSSKSQTQTPVFVPPPLAVAATTPALFQTTSLTTSTRSIMPLRAARLFDSSESDFGPWHIVLSGRCIQDWRGLKDSAKLNAVENVLVALSKGDFGPTNHKRLIHESDIIIYEAKVLSDLRMVYQIDLEDGLEGESVKQILRIWGLESHSSLDKRVWSAIGRYTARRGPEYRRRVNYRLAPNFKGATSRPFSLPASFPAVANESVGPVEAVGDLTEAEMLKVHELLALGKYIPFSKAVARSVLAQDDEAVHLFQLSPLEKTVVYHDSSAFVIGRSGTGKTTSILLRILSYQKAEEAHPNIMETFLRQVFITQSNLLASKVRKYYESIWRTFASSGLSKEEAAKLAIARATAARDDLEDVEDESAGLRGLPSRFSELTAEHYPLFVSWDTLVLLLENDYNIMWGAKRKRSEGHRQIFKKFKLENAVDVMAQLGVGNEPIDDLEEPEDDDTLSSMSRLFDHYIDADVFTSWWPSFNQQLTKGIEPALCWNEILGTICGSEASIDTQGGYLSREEYLQLSERAHSTYASHRGAIYSIFEAYRVRKNSQDDFDRSDRTHELIRQLKQRPIPRGSQLHMVSVDEAQDLLLADFRLLRHLCSNPKGWIWAGDTAQTINSGSSFRFDDLKASMFRQEVLAASSTDREPVNPDIFKLSLNYRSHCGITRMADSLVKAITKLFPNTIDVLPPEEGKVDGPAPVWIASGDESEGQSRRVMFDRQFYKNAVFCYDKAGASFEKEVAEAFEARRVLRVNARSKVGRVDVGAYALVAAKFRAAADKATGTQAKNLYRPCGELFLQAKRMEEAARAFELGDNFEQAAILFLNLGKKFHDDAIRIVKTGKTTSTTREKVQQTCRLHYLKHSRLDKARDLFESDEELLEYMTDYDFEDARVAFYISVGRFADAANIEISAGNLQAAADLFHQEGDHLSEASNLVRLVTGLLPFGISLSQKSQQVKAALSAIKQATEAASNLQVDFKPQLARYNAACAPYLDVNVLLPLAVECAGRRDHLGQLYCLELALSVHPDLNAPSSVRRYLLEFGNYTGLIKTLSTESAFSDNSLLFFGISVNPSSDELLILPQCPFATSDTSTTRELAQGLCQQYLLEHLEKRLTEMSRALLGYSAVRIPCVEFSLSQTCTTSPCPRAHFTKSEFTKGLRDRTEILQLILGLLPTYTFIATNLPDSATDARERVKTVQKAEQMRWDSVFVQTIHPPHPSCGALLDAQDTPGFDITAKNVASRAQDRLFEIKINDQSAWYTFLSSAIIASDFSQESFRRYIYRVPIAKWPKGRFYLAHDRRATTEILASYLATPLRADLNGGTLWNVFYVLQSIVEREMVVDLSLLIFFIEDLSALSLLRAPSEAVQVNSWDGIMAPRDFLRRMLRRHSQRTVVGVSLSLKRHLLTLMEKLCAHVYEGNSYLRYNGIALPGTGFMRNVFAFRLSASALQTVETPVLTPSHTGSEPWPLLERGVPNTFKTSFYKASNFEALAQAVGTASNLFELDKFLVIDFYGRPPRYSANRIDAKNLAEVEARLFSSSTLSATASPFIPFLPPHETPILDADEDVEVTDTKLQKAPDIVEPTPQEKAQQEAVNAAEQARQGAAARVIVKHVRSYAERRRQRKSHDSMPHILLWATYSSLCAPKRLKPVVLGPLVEIVFSLQGQIRRIQAAKNLLKKMRQDAEGDDLLKVADQTTAINKLRKTLDKFLDPLTIAPKSTTAKPMVSKGNILDLRVHLKGCRDIFLETEQLLREIHGVEPQPSHLALRTFFDLGEKGILTLPKARASKPTESKPEMGAMDAVAVEGDEEEAERLGRERAR
ncbi:hypothetical protein P7C70_g960, partial [Phenoliferia sp. Uapishka_3]